MGICGGEEVQWGEVWCLPAAAVKACTDVELAFEVSEQEAFEGGIALLMQGLGE